MQNGNPEGAGTIPDAEMYGNKHGTCAMPLVDSEAKMDPATSLYFIYIYKKKIIHFVPQLCPQCNNCTVLY